MPDNKTIGNRLRAAREAIAPNPPNPRQFAIKATVDPSQYSKAEKGEKGLGDDKIVDICSTWHINQDWLLTGKGNMFITSEGGKSGRQDNDEKEKGLTMQALFELAAGNRSQSDALKSATRTAEELTILLKEKHSPTVNADSRNRLETLSTVLGMRRLLEQLASKVNKQSLEVIQDALDSMVMEERRNLEHTGIVTGDGRQSKG